jgi:adenine-specific DNA methylase
MGSLSEGLEAREAAARVRVEELEAEVAGLSGRLELAREGLERLWIARETVAEVLAEMTPQIRTVTVDDGQPPEGERMASAYATPDQRKYALTA